MLEQTGFAPEQGIDLEFTYDAESSIDLPQGLAVILKPLCEKQSNWILPEERSSAVSDQDMHFLNTVREYRRLQNPMNVVYGFIRRDARLSNTKKWLESEFKSRGFTAAFDYDFETTVQLLLQSRYVQFMDALHSGRPDLCSVEALAKPKNPSPNLDLR